MYTHYGLYTHNDKEGTIFFFEFFKTRILITYKLMMAHCVQKKILGGGKYE